MYEFTIFHILICTFSWFIYKKVFLKLEQTRYQEKYRADFKISSTGELYEKTSLGSINRTP